MDCKKQLKDFLEDKPIGKPLLLGVSGGSDSLAMLLMFNDLYKSKTDLHVVHIDHSWEKNSAEEALELKQEVEKLGLNFHLFTLNQPVEQRNMEETARISRLKIFKELYQKLDCQALVLAHQSDDQAELVLKRLLEGAQLQALGGLKKQTILDGMIIWRPFLDVSKKDLMRYLEDIGKRWFTDPANSDGRFLRARMRESILPQLTGVFGKEVSKNLATIGKDSQEFSAYLFKKVEPYFKQISKEEFKIFIDFNPLFPVEVVELKYFMKLFLEGEGFCPSKALLLDMEKHLMLNSSNIKFLSKKQTVLINKRKLTLLK